MSMSYRVLTDLSDVARAAAVFWRSMVGLPPLGEIDPVPTIEQGRFLGAFDGREIVGCAGSYTSLLTVPGGKKIPQAAVTLVGVLPTHTRRGILTELMRRQLADFAERGEIVMTGLPSQGTIYERFGCGVATVSASARLVRSRARLSEGVDAGGLIRLLDQSEAPGELPRIHDMAQWTGSMRRPDGWWLLHHLAQQAGPIKPYRAVHGPAGREDGFVIYRPLRTEDWLHSRERTIVVDDFCALSASAYAGLLRHLLSMDTVDVIEFASMPADDVLSTLFQDPRAVQDFRIADEAWIRIIDVPAALGSRAYREAAPVVIEVSDPLIEENSGSYLIGTAGAARTDAPADVRVDVASLGRVFLGGTRWWQLARSGRAAELVPGAIEAADELFMTSELPYCGTSF
jgi:predicted acetyltransferase